MIFVGTTGLSRPLSVKTLLGRSSLSKASGTKSVSKMSGEEESLEKCAQSIVENSVSCSVLFVNVEFVIEQSVEFYTCICPEISSVVLVFHIEAM